RRPRKHHACHRKPPPLSGRQYGGSSIRRRCQSDSRQRIIDLGSAHGTAQTDFENEIFACCQFRLQPVAVREVAQACAVSVAVRSDRATAPGDRPLLRRQESGENAKQRGFARAIRSGDMHTMAGRGLDGNPVDHLAFAAPDLNIPRGKS
ncbi:MAG TPA: hypothetical protein VLD59_05425, partial [Steroidobacteraceae bacterium]|nr:hypothetical protein [Steroidobacteraceae bacterium]